MQLTDDCVPDKKNPQFDFERFLASYKGGISPEEGRALARYAESIDCGDIVEIGSFKGKSAVAFAHGLRRNPDSTSQIFCVEPHEYFVGVYGGVFGAEDRGDFFRIMVETGYYDRVSLINLKSDAAANAWHRPIRMLFIDGDHSYSGVLTDVTCWESFVEVGGLIVFDDSVDPAIGPWRVVNELLETQRFKLLERVGKITFLRKLSSVLESTPLATD